jgi:hypothetical protein
MQPEITGDQQDHDYDADNAEDVHLSAPMAGCDEPDLAGKPSRSTRLGKYPSHAKNGRVTPLPQGLSTHPPHATAKEPEQHENEHDHA